MRIYLVGAGVIARTHVEAARKMPESVEFRVADVSSAVLDGFAALYPDITRFPDTASMLASESPRDDDVVIVATPPFAPSVVEIRAAVMARPETSADPRDVVFDVETAVAASLILHRTEGPLLVSYQRASAMNGEEIFRAELEGTRGSLRWTPFDSDLDVVLRTDEGEGPVERVVEPEPRTPFAALDFPIVHFADAIGGRPNLALLGEHAVANFHWVRAMYDAAGTGQPQVVDLTGAGGTGR